MKLCIVALLVGTLLVVADCSAGDHADADSSGAAGGPNSNDKPTA